MARRKSDPAGGGEATSGPEATAVEPSAGTTADPEAARTVEEIVDAPAGSGTEPGSDTASGTVALPETEPDAVEKTAALPETGPEPEQARAADPVAYDPVAHETPVHDVEEHEEEAGASFASRALTFLLLLLAGGALGIWAAPKVAPMLPSGLAPVAAWLTPGASDSAAQLADLDTRLGAVDSRVSDLAQRAPDIDPAEIEAQAKAAADGVETRLAAQIAELRTALSDIDGAETRQRIGRLESAIGGQSTELAALKEQLSGGAAAASSLSEETVARIDVYRAELDGLRAEMGTLSDSVAALSSRIDEVATTANRSIETAQATVAEIQTEASTALDAAGTAADLALIKAALAAGAPFTEAADRLAAAPNVVLPDGLAAAAGGVPTLAALRDSFPEAAHAAIRASILAGAGDGILARARAYLEAQVASRSLTPVEGNGPDAVLSRMEADLRTDDLAGALTESGQLPTEAAAAMQSWLDGARQRVEAERGLAELSGSVPATN